MRSSFCQCVIAGIVSSQTLLACGSAPQDSDSTGTVAAKSESALKVGGGKHLRNHGDKERQIANAGVEGASPVFEESCEPPPDVEIAPPSTDPYYAVVIDAERPMGALMRNAASSINDAGQVAGTFNPGSDLEEWRPWLWTSGTTVDIQDGGVTYGFADALNESGVVLGHFIRQGDTNDFVYHDGAFQVLQGFDAWQLNDGGDLVGTSKVLGGPAVRFSDRDILLEGLGQGALARAINNRREIAGSADLNGTGEQHAFVLSCGQTRDLGTLGGNWSAAYDLNERGEVAGVSRNADGANYVFVERSGELKQLFPHDARAGVAINERGEVVNGQYLASGNSVYVLKDLVAHESCWTMISANDINDQGDIAGWGRSCSDPATIAPALVVTQHPEHYRLPN